MQLQLLFCLLFALVYSTPESEWDDIDYEIFDLNDSLGKLRAPGTTFYDVLEIDASSDLKTISSAYRKVSLKYHPDKATGPENEEFSKILTSVGKILKDPESKAKYDAHLSKGFPIWRGSGYYYKKYRPGLFSVLVIIIIFISSVQYWSAWGIYLLEKYIQESEGNSKKKVKRKELKKPVLTNVLFFQIPFILINGIRKSTKKQD